MDLNATTVNLANAFNAGDLDLKPKAVPDFDNAPSNPDDNDNSEDNNDGSRPKAKRAKKDVPVKTREMRLEQNRKAARESRKRKKVLVEELQRSVIFFSRANGTLRSQNEEMEQMLLQAQAQMQAMEGVGQQQQPMVASPPWAMMGQQPNFQQPAPAPKLAAAPSASPNAGLPFNMAGLAGMNGMDPNQFNGMAVPQGMSQGNQSTGQFNMAQQQDTKQQNPTLNQNQGGGEQPQQQQQQPQQAPIDNNLLANWMNLQAAMAGGVPVNPAMMSPFMNLNPAAAGMGGVNPAMMPFAFPGFMNQGAGGMGVNNPLANMGTSPNLNGGGANV